MDLKRPEYEPSPADEYELLDLRRRDTCLQATRGVTQVYHLAADMGGIGYITESLAEIAKNNILINAHMLEASQINRIGRFLFSSSACVYAQYRQESPDVAPLKEEDAYPAAPEPGYGWEKLFAEELCRHFHRDFQLDTRIVRFHNVYGPLGTYDGGEEKAPAAVCRKVAIARDGDEIEIWGDGKQTRSFMYVGDCVEGLIIAGKKLVKRYDLSKPQGVRGRNSDTTRLREVLKWEPSTSLKEGITLTYQWIEAMVQARSRR